MPAQSLLTALDDRYQDSVRTRVLLYAAVVAAAVVLPFLLADYRINLLINIAVYAIMATAFNFAFGFAAVPSFGHAAFFAIGGYGIIMVLSYSESIPLVGDGLVVPVVITLGIAILGAVLMGVIALRGIGLYFALLTFGLAELLHQMIIRLSFTGGGNGLTFLPPDLPFGFAVTPLLVYYLALGTLVVGLVAFAWILRSPFGRSMRAVRANDQRAKYVGYPVNRIKLLTFVISAAVTTLGGIYIAMYTFFVGPGRAAADVSLELLFITVIGGSSFLLGPTLGAVFLQITEVFSGDLGNFSRIAVGVVFIIVILYAPAGVYGKLVQLWHWLTD